MVTLIISNVNAQEQNEEVEDLERMVYATIGGPETLDPAWSYDTASGEIIFHVYDNLIAYDGDSLSEFVPMIALQVPSDKNGLIKYGGLDYIFPIRYGVKFHNGDILTPEDVEYSFERGMIFDRAGGPMWMLLEPLLGIGSIEDLAVESICLMKKMNYYLNTKRL